MTTLLSGVFSIEGDSPQIGVHEHSLISESCFILKTETANTFSLIFLVFSERTCYNAVRKQAFPKNMRCILACEERQQEVTNE